MLQATHTQPFAPCYDDVEPWQCFTEGHRCPRCGGWDVDPHNPCGGYVSKDGSHVVCTNREDPELRILDDDPTIPELSVPEPTLPEPEPALAEPAVAEPASEEPAGEEPPLSEEPEVEEHHADPFLAHERSLTSAELLSLDEASIGAASTDAQASDWLVDERLPSVGCSLLVGRAETGKSRLVRDLALAVARGAPWLGFRTRRGPVLAISVDAGLAELRRSYEQMGLAPSDPIHFLCAPAGSGVLGRAREVIRTLAPSLVVVDSVGPLEAAEGNAEEEASCSALDRVLALGEGMGTHVLAVHRLARPGGRELSALLGSTERELDTILLVSRISGQRVVRSVQRRGANVELALPEVAQVAPPATLGDTCEHVVVFLRRATRPVTLREVVDNVPGQPGRILTALEQLRRRGRVLQTGSGGRDDPFRYTGCDPIGGVDAEPWLRKMRPWVRPSR